jgi:hypothetical protein
MRLVSAIVNVNIYTHYSNKIYAQESSAYVQVIGKIFDEAEKKPLKNSTVYLYVRDNGKWQLWPGEKYNNQRNPQVVNENSEYIFLVPEGEYYIHVVSLGYYAKDSERFMIQKNPVRINVYMPLASPLWKVILGFGVGAFVITIIVIGTKAFVLWSEKQQIKRAVLRKVEDQAKSKIPDLPGTEKK